MASRLRFTSRASFSTLASVRTMLADRYDDVEQLPKNLVHLDINLEFSGCGKYG